ncbi:AEC family transporter [Acuticoccus mangrovi]|uniref:AEC family transporter n=1 Tax=Acuticoccus mangrovi TaxID=2796142 RepID=A0A934IHZ7_9HYPH|nr:AEC family transporter [Acuticoccus mangrovi]MBJ3777064.1 AEC family transporter [Acuticoccus mangrovi]
MQTLVVVLPIFALIFAGWLVRRIGVLGPHATVELNRFVVFLALPALLFDIVASADWAELWQPGFVAAFGLGSAAVFVLTICLRLRGRYLADATIDGLNAAYANAGFIGFPLAVAIFGPAALAPTMIATILTACILFAVALILVEIGLAGERPSPNMLRTVALRFARSPLIVAPVLGAVVMASGVGLPGPVEHFVDLLGQAASPCALIALGLFLAEPRPTAEPVTRTTVLLGSLKLFGQPAATWLLAVEVFHLAPPLAATATLLAALPTGTGPFMVAELYGRESSVTSRVILGSTIASLATITPLLALVG